MPTETTTNDKASVGARCAACDDEHPLGDRPMGTVTTQCPHCGDTRYESISYGQSHIKPDAERIADVVRDINGVGEQTVENILDTFPSYYDFVGADASVLRRIDGVGRQIADRITEKR